MHRFEYLSITNTLLSMNDLGFRIISKDAGFRI
jgi:hypothetical protein